MPIPTPFHDCTAPLCHTQEWREWAGYLSAATYEPSYEREYYAIRSAAALIDISPLFKYEFHGPDAERSLNRIMTRDISQCRVGQVMYSPWCDDAGRVIDDGTVQRLDQDRFRVTAADPNLRWFMDCSLGLDVVVEDLSESMSALALQGPLSRQILLAAGAGRQLEALNYFHVAEIKLGSLPVIISRTGYTGDLGYELWVAAERSALLWERIMAAGADYGLCPVGLAALDIARIEAGLLLIEVDYISSLRALIEAQTSTPYDLGLGWTVHWGKGDFVGRSALLPLQDQGPEWKLVGLEVSWESLEAIFGEVDLPPQVAGRASRAAVPLYLGGRQVGQVTSSAFSPILKKFIALGTVIPSAARTGNQLHFEITVEYSRRLVPARVVPLPFYDPPHKKA